jgi:hypothetical protein
MKREFPLGVQLFLLAGVLSVPCMAFVIAWHFLGLRGPAWPVCFVTAIWGIVQLVKLGEHVETETARYRTPEDEYVEALKEITPPVSGIGTLETRLNSVVGISPEQMRRMFQETGPQPTEENPAVVWKRQREERERFGALKSAE